MQAGGHRFDPGTLHERPSRAPAPSAWARAAGSYPGTPRRRYAPPLRRGPSVPERPKLGSYGLTMDALLSWLVELLGPRAVRRTALLVALACAVATAAFVVVLIIVLSR